MRGLPTTPPGRFRNNACKDDSALSFRFLHGGSQQLVGSAMRVKTCFFVKSTNSKYFFKKLHQIFFFWLSSALIGQFSPVDFPHKKKSNIVKQSALIQKAPVEIFRTFKKLFISCIYTVQAILTHAQREVRELFIMLVRHRPGPE